MITRKYFYAARLSLEGGRLAHTDGLLRVRSWLPKNDWEVVGMARDAVIENLQDTHGESADASSVNLLAFNRMPIL